MSKPLTPLQDRVTLMYDGGEFAHIDNMESAAECGDTLLLFCLREANDAATAEEFCSMLDSAARQLQDMRAAIEAATGV